MVSSVVFNDLLHSNLEARLNEVASMRGHLIFLLWKGEKIMDVITGSRQSGKTTEVIKRAMEKNLVIVVRDEYDLDRVANMIKKMNEDIASPVYPDILIKNSYIYYNYRYRNATKEYVREWFSLEERKCILDDGVILQEVQERYRRDGIELDALVVCMPEVGTNDICVVTKGIPEEIYGDVETKSEPVKNRKANGESIQSLSAILEDNDKRNIGVILTPKKHAFQVAFMMQRMPKKIKPFIIFYDSFFIENAGGVLDKMLVFFWNGLEYIEGKVSTLRLLRLVAESSMSVSNSGLIRAVLINDDGKYSKYAQNFEDVFEIAATIEL